MKMEHNCPEPVRLWLSLPTDFIREIMPDHELDFTLDSLELVDQCLGAFRRSMTEWSQEESQRKLNMLMLGWGAYIGEVVRRTDPTWRWELPDPGQGKLPYLFRYGPGGMGQLQWPAMDLVLVRLQGTEEINVSAVCREQLDAVERLFQEVAAHPELLEP